MCIRDRQCRRDRLILKRHLAPATIAGDLGQNGFSRRIRRRIAIDEMHRAAQHHLIQPRRRCLLRRPQMADETPQHLAEGCLLYTSRCV